MPNKKLLKFPPTIILIFISLYLISFCLDDAPILLMEFKIFLNKWFYNGIYHTISIGGKDLNSYIPYKIDL